MLKKGLGIGLVCLLFVMGTGLAFAAESMTITGVISPENQLVAEDGLIYDIAETEAGTSLLENAGKKVKVIGTVEVAGEAKKLTVESFEVVPE